MRSSIQGPKTPEQDVPKNLKRKVYQTIDLCTPDSLGHLHSYEDEKQEQKNETI